MTSISASLVISPLAFALAAGVLLAACSNDVQIIPEHAGASSGSSSSGTGTSSSSSTSSSTTQGGTTGGGGASSSSGVGSTGSGPAPRVNTPDTDPAQWSYNSVLIQMNDPPIKLLDGPFMVTSVGSKGGYPTGLTYIVNGDCTVPDFSSEVQANGGLPVLPGQVICFVYSFSGSPSPPTEGVTVVGYRPYP